VKRLECWQGFLSRGKSGTSVCSQKPHEGQGGCCTNRNAAGELFMVSGEILSCYAATRIAVLTLQLAAGYFAAF